MSLQSLLVTPNRARTPKLASKSINTPPPFVAGGTAQAGTLPTEDGWIVAPGGTGAWLGQDGNIAYFDQYWRFIVPQPGFMFYITDEGRFYSYNMNGWFRQIDGSSSAAATQTGAIVNSTKQANAGAVTPLGLAAGQTVNLPAATGSGDVYEYVLVVNMTGSLVFKSNPTTDYFIGFASEVSDDGVGGPIKGFVPAGTDNTITFNGSTTGGYIGQIIQVRDVAPGFWSVRSFGKGTGTEATPFSHV